MNRREAIQRTGLVLGYAVSVSALSGIVASCTTKPALTYKPDFFNDDQALLMSEIAQIIIPKTETAGAKEVGVPAFIDRMVKECYKKEDQDQFLAGLETFENEAKKTHGSSFVTLEPEKQLLFVKTIHDEAVKKIKSDGGQSPKPFIINIKELTLLGFFTSKVGATEVLQYSAVPGEYKGCIPLAEVGKTWAT